MSKTARRQRMTGPRGGRYLATLPLAAGLALAMAGPAQSGTPSDLHFVTSIGVGSVPGTIAVNPNTNRVYVAPLQGNVVSVISGAKNRVTATIPVPSRPFGLAVNPATNTVYVRSQRKVFVINGATNQITASISNASEQGGIAVDSATNTIYADGVSDVVEISGATNKIVASLPVVPGILAVDPATNVIYAADQADESVTVVSGTTHHVVASLPAGGPIVGMDLNPATDTVYVVHLKEATLRGMTVIDGRTNTIVANPTLGSFPWGLAVDPASNSVFVTIGNQSGTSPVNLVREFSGVTNKEVDRTSLPDSPGGIAVNPATDTIYVGDFFTTKVASAADTGGARRRPSRPVQSPGRNRDPVAHHRARRGPPGHRLHRQPARLDGPVGAASSLARSADSTAKIAIPRNASSGWPRSGPLVTT